MGSEATEDAVDYIALLIREHAANPQQHPQIPAAISRSWLQSEIERFTRERGINRIDRPQVALYLSVSDIFCPF